MHPQTKLEDLSRLRPDQKEALKRLGLITVNDILRYLPIRYGDVSEAKQIEHLVPDEIATIFGRISKLETKKSFKSHIAMATAKVKDDTGTVPLIWFNQAYIAKMFDENSLVKVSGKVSSGKQGLFFSNPHIESVAEVPSIAPGSLFGKDSSEFLIYPIYNETKGVTSSWIYYTIQKIFRGGILDTIIDPIPKDIIEKYHLPTLSTALVWIHAPKKKDDFEAARKRFAFEEIFMIQLQRQREKELVKDLPSVTIKGTKILADKFAKTLPYTLTEGQKKVIESINLDLERGYPMSRLLEGDVGSGKTAVAASISYAVIQTPPKDNQFGHIQVAYMAPTEILATQHFESFISFFKHLPIEIGLMTGSVCKKFPSKTNPNSGTAISKAQLTKWTAEGKISLLIGTHSLIQKKIKFKNLGLTIIDEQHRFGITQRQALVRRTSPEQTQNIAEKTNAKSPDFIYKDLTYIVRGILFEVKKTLGGGHKEIIYQRAIEEELLKRKIKFDREKQIPILYKNKKVGVYVPDFVIDEKIVLELKAIPFIGSTEKKQLWTYLKGSAYKLGILANFSQKELTIDRVIYDKARDPSASDLRSSAYLPHLLSMTATPIPRTLALTIYGDLDLSILAEMPKGRKPVETKIVMTKDREKTYEEIRKELKEGRQLYVICPRINEPDPSKEKAVNARSVKEESERLKTKVFPEYEIDIIHSKMTPKEKEGVMKDFADKKIDILVATSVVEVGVNVPNASVMIIEGAERFGLAQLHQLRGRIIRGEHQPKCFVFVESNGDKTIERLRAFQTAKNGFELSELDLKQRGGGALSQGKQWGVSDIAMEALKNIKLVEAAREEAKKIVADDVELNHFPILREIILSKEFIHFE